MRSSDSQYAAAGTDPPWPPLLKGGKGKGSPPSKGGERKGEPPSKGGKGKGSPLLMGGNLRTNAEGNRRSSDRVVFNSPGGATPRPSGRDGQLVHGPGMI